MYKVWEWIFFSKFILNTLSIHTASIAKIGGEKGFLDRLSVASASKQLNKVYHLIIESIFVEQMNRHENGKRRGEQ